MIYGIGTDIIEIDRVNREYCKISFNYGAFTEYERDFASGSRECLAGMYAAKESFVKALGTGFKGFYPNEIEIRRGDRDKPYIVLYNNAKKLYDSLGITHMHVSISHCKNYATATVVLECE